MFLTDTQRDEALARLDEDGFVVLPEPLPADLLNANAQAIRDLAAAAKPEGGGWKAANCVDAHPAFRELMMYPPALQLAHDTFGPIFQLNQSNYNFRPTDGGSHTADFVHDTPWHADGPRPRLFPAIDGRMGLHYLKFGYFLNDLTAGGGGALQVVRGSHKRPEKDGRGADFRIADYAADLVTFDVPAGTAVAFHQALWHAAPTNTRPDPRLTVYISYCPTWMRPLDREPLPLAELAAYTPAEQMLLGFQRPPMQFWLPPAEHLHALDRYARQPAVAAV